MIMMPNNEKYYVVVRREGNKEQYLTASYNWLLPSIGDAYAKYKDVNEALWDAKGVARSDRYNFTPKTLIYVKEVTIEYKLMKNKMIKG